PPAAVGVLFIIGFRSRPAYRHIAKRTNDDLAMAAHLDRRDHRRHRCGPRPESAPAPVTISADNTTTPRDRRYCCFHRVRTGHGDDGTAGKCAGALQEPGGIL